MIMIEQMRGVGDQTMRLFQAIKERRIEEALRLYASDATVYSPLLGEVYPAEAVRRLRMFFENVASWHLQFELSSITESRSCINSKIQVMKFGETARAEINLRTMLMFRGPLIVRHIDHLDDLELSMAFTPGFVKALCFFPSFRKKVLTDRLGYFEFDGQKREDLEVTEQASHWKL